MHYALPQKYPNSLAWPHILHSTFWFEKSKEMGTFQLGSLALSSSSSSMSLNFNQITKSHITLKPYRPLNFSRGRKIRAVSTVPDSDQSETTEPEEPPSVDFAFVNVSFQILFHFYNFLGFN